MNTVYTNGYYGHNIETKIDLDNSRLVTISTMKRSSGLLVTFASVGTRNGDFISSIMFQDFTKNLASQKVRVTEKAVRLQHQQALDGIESLLAEIEDFYSKETA